VVEWRGSHFLKVRKNKKELKRNISVSLKKMCLLIRH